MNNINEKNIPSSWIIQNVQNINFKNKIIYVLDFASGNGRHSIQLAKDGMLVTAIDKNQEKLNFYKYIKNIKTICFNLETDEDWPLTKNTYDIVIVTNYLYRPNIKKIGNLVKDEGYILYETFAKGNQIYGRPQNSNYLLEERELIDTFKDKFEVVSYFNGYLEIPNKRVIQRSVLKKKAFQ